MIYAFSNNSDPKKIIKYRTAYVVEESGDIFQFKYCLLDRTEINKQTYLRGIEMQEYSKMIRTNFEYDFTVKTKIVIDNVQYTIANIYTEQSDQQNGLFVKEFKPFKILTLNR